MSSPDNEVAKRIRRLGVRHLRGIVLLEGPRVIRQAVAAGVRLDVLALREGDELDVEADRTMVMSRALFNSLSTTESPQGAIAIGRSGPVEAGRALAAARSAGWPLVVLDGVQDPGNVGAIARSAAAAGAVALLVLPGSADPFGPKAIRASAGHVFHLTVAAGTWDDIAGLAKIGASAAGGPLAGGRLELAEALIFGSEAHGLSRDIPSVALPMADGVDSLNVAAAAAILLYELRRLRSA